QIWFGHRIPVWYQSKLKNQKSKIKKNQPLEIYVGVEPPVGEDWQQDPDTLDTWFSSGTWTFSTLGWPKQTKDLKTFHPTSVIETGYDILFFWIARMIMMSQYAVKQIPFKTVYLHGLVRDKQGRKMSKSLGNGIDPLDMIAKYGTDALRLAMLVGNTPGNDFRLYDEKIAGFRNFVNKLWNISRYILMTLDKVPVIINNPQPKTLADKWILTRLNIVNKTVTQHINDFEFSPAAEKLYDFTWHELADWYLEIAKIEKGKDDILNYILATILKLWHPFAPFVTEVLWQEAWPKEKLLMVQAWPKVISQRNIKAEDDMKVIQDIITAVRNFRAENKVAKEKVLDCFIDGASTTIFDQKKLLEGLRTNIKLSSQSKNTNHKIAAGKLSVYLSAPN
ncbi:TPA: valine--tRNA ligase, partial [Patescibacteria group bacterium]|nr:valine--tRNA ligase [Patescibacteria group bacterium]